MTQAHPRDRFVDRVALISGAGRGLGAATALRLSQEGAIVVVNDINAENAKSIATQIESLGGKVYVSTHDISDRSQVEILVSEVLHHFGRIDILVNNAGIIRDGMLHKLPKDAFDEVIPVNLKGVFNLGQACAKHMRKKNTDGSSIFLRLHDSEIWDNLIMLPRRLALLDSRELGLWISLPASLIRI